MKIANDFTSEKNENSVYISIHHNQDLSNTNTRGIETYYYDGVNHYNDEYPPDPIQLEFHEDSKRLAENVHPRLINNLGLIDREIRYDQSFYAIRNAQMPAILVELGFMTNPTEEQLIKSNAFQQNAAQALADSVINYFKVFEVFDSNNNKLKTFLKKADAISYAEELIFKTTLFDKDKQKIIFLNQPIFGVLHQANGPMNILPLKRNSFLSGVFSINSNHCFSEHFVFKTPYGNQGIRTILRTNLFLDKLGRNRPSTTSN